MNEHYLRNVIEAALLAAGRPVQPAELIQLFDENARPTAEQLRAAIDALAAEYAERGIELKETASGVRIQVRRELAAEVSRLWPERPARYSRALLETLALIAYRQPITRGEIEAVRGVAVNPHIVKTLLERNWVRVVGNRDVPGRPELLGTTRDFLDYFGLKSLDELPPLSELKAVGDINLQLDLQGEPAQPAQTDGEGAAAVPEAAASAEEAGESAGAPAEAIDDFDELPAIADERATADEPTFAVGPTDGAHPSGAHPTSGGHETRDAYETRGAESPSDAEPSEEALLEGAVDNGIDNASEPDTIEADDEDDGEEGDELSAEGGDSRELVAAPRDSGD